MRYLFLAISLGIMALIFYFSSQTADQSSATSGAVYTALKGFFLQFLPESFVVAVLGILRKLAHAFIFACLGASVSICVFTFPFKEWLFWVLPFLISLVYAASDEIHQLFVEGRAGLISDVGIDAIGIVVAVTICNLVRLLIAKCRQKRAQTQ